MQKIRAIYNSPKYHSKIVFIGLQLLFITFTFVFLGVFLNKNLSCFLVTNDSGDHVQEAQEIAYDISHFRWSGFTFSYGIPGVAMATYYPWGAFIPIIITDLLKISLLTGLKIMLLLLTYMGFNIFFYSALAYCHCKGKALLFTLIATISSVYINMVTTSADYSALIGVPIAVMTIFGWLCWLKSGKWQMMAVSISLLFYIHFVSIYIIAIMLGLATLLDIKAINKQKIFNAAKAILAIIGSTAFIWIPLFYINMTNQVDLPIHHFVQDNLSANNLLITQCPITDIIGVIVLLLLFKHLTYLQKVFTILELFALICTYRIIPLSWTARTPLRVVQFTTRYMMMGHFILAVVLTSLVYQVLRHDDASQYLQALTYMFLSLFIVINASTVISCQKLYASNHQTAVKQSFTQRGNDGYQQANDNYHIVTTDKNSHSALQGHFFIGEYMPLSVMKRYEKGIQTVPDMDFRYSYIPDLQLQHQMERHHIKCIDSGLEFNNKHTEYNRRIPITLYHDQRYHLFLNGKPMKHWEYSSHEPKLEELPKGKQKITFTAPTMWYRYLATVVSILSVLTWITLEVDKKKRDARK